jgi:hypothetical protein
MQYFLYVKFTLKAFQFVPFVKAAEALNGAMADVGWQLVAACSAVTGVAFPGTIIHVWEVPGPDARLSESDQPHSPLYQKLLELCEEPNPQILTSMPYSDRELEIPRDDKRIHNFLAAEIVLLEGMSDLFNEKATLLVDKVKDLGWTLIAAGSTAPSTVFHLWELSSADAVLNGMRVFGDTKPYAELLECCEKHTQQLFTAMPYNPSGGNPQEE